MPVDLLRPPPARRRLVQNQRPDTIGIGGGEGHGDEAAVARGEDRRALRSRLVEDGPKVIDERLDWWDIPGREPLRAAEAAPVGDDHSRDPSQGSREARECWVLPIQDDVGELALDIDEVHRAVSHDLVSERVVAVPGIADIGSLHRQHRRSDAPWAASAHEPPATGKQALVRAGTLADGAAAR